MATAAPPLLAAGRRIRARWSTRRCWSRRPSARADAIEARARRRRRPRRHGAGADRRSGPAAQGAGRPGEARSGRASPATRTAARSTPCCCARSTRSSGRPARDRRPAAPLVVRPRRRRRRPRGDRRRRARRAWSARPRWPGARDVVLFDAREAIGGAARRRGGRAAPHRLAGAAGLLCRARSTRVRRCASAAPVAADDLAGFDEVVLAVGSTEVLPEVAGHRARAAVVGGDRRGPALAAAAHLLVVDDGFGWWPCASAVELGVRAGCATITVVTPGAGFGASLPPEGRVQLLGRLRGAPLQVRPLTALGPARRGDRGAAERLSGAEETVAADAVVVVGERVARDWRALVPAGAGGARDRRRARARARSRTRSPRGAPRPTRSPARDRARPRPWSDQAIRTSVLPSVSPASVRTSASGARSRPSTIVSR